MCGEHEERSTSSITCSLRWKHLGSEGVKRFAKEAFSRNLTELDLCGVGCNDEGAKILAVAFLDSRLRTLNISSNPFSDNGFVAFADMLEKSRTLTSIDLSGNRASDVGIVKIAESLSWLQGKNTTLRSLSLNRHAQGQGIGMNGMRALATMLANNAVLEDLHLWGSCIDDAGAAALAGVAEGSGLANNECLTLLDLGWNFCGDGACNALAAMLRFNTTLTTLDLRNNNVSLLGLQAFISVLEVVSATVEDGPEVGNVTVQSINIAGNKMCKGARTAINPTKDACEGGEGSGGEIHNVLLVVDNEDTNNMPKDIPTNIPSIDSTLVRQAGAQWTDNQRVSTNEYCENPNVAAAVAEPATKETVDSGMEQRLREAKEISAGMQKLNHDQENERSGNNGKRESKLIAAARAAEAETIRNRLLFLLSERERRERTVQARRLFREAKAAHAAAMETAASAAAAKAEADAMWMSNKVHFLARRVDEKRQDEASRIWNRMSDDRRLWKGSL